MHLLIKALLISLIASTLPAIAAQDLRAITEDGRKVVLSPDGKWKFDNKATSASPSIDSASIYQPVVKRFSLNFNPEEWNLTPKRDGEEPNKRSFQHKSLPIYALVVSDELPITTPAMKNIILSNAKSAGAATTVLIDKTQDLGGKEVGYLRFAATMKGLEVVFSSYYYADSDGNIQVMCYTGQSLFFKYEGDCQKFMNGLTIK
jgi:hypothetical protein